MAATTTISTKTVDTHSIAANATSVDALQEQVIVCRACPRLVDWREEVARVKRRMYRDEPYWGAPLAAFGDPQARLLVVGLAPAAHGGNRTGLGCSPATAAATGCWRAIPGWFRQPAGVGSAGRRACAGRRFDYGGGPLRSHPPTNPPPLSWQPAGPYIAREIELLADLRVVVALGRIAFDAFLRAYADSGRVAPSENRLSVTLLNRSCRTAARCSSPATTPASKTLRPAG